MENTALAPVVPGDEQAYLAMISEQFRSNTTSDKDLLPRVRIERENLENDNGDILMPAGCFSIDDPASGGRIYAKDIGFRYFMHYYRYKRYDAHAQRLTRDGDTAIGAYVHSVLVKGVGDEAPSDDGGFQCGRPLGYIRDWKSLPETDQEFFKSCRQMAIFFGEFTFDGIDADGHPVIQTMPGQMELSNKKSGRTLDSFYADLNERKRINPNSLTVNLKSKRVKGGVTFYDLSPSMDDTARHSFDDASVELVGRFLSYVQTTNQFVMERHRSKIDARDEEEKAGFIDVDSDD